MSCYSPLDPPLSRRPRHERRDPGGGNVVGRWEERGRRRRLPVAVSPGRAGGALQGPEHVAQCGGHRRRPGDRQGGCDAVAYQGLKATLMPVVLAALEDLRCRFDVVVCEGAGGIAEINLRASDLANLGLAQAASLPVVVVGDIDRGGVFASAFGSLALLDAEDQRLVRAFVINKFRGDVALLRPGLAELERRTGRGVLGVLPWVRGLELDAEDSLAVEAPRTPKPARPGSDRLVVAVVRLPRLSNFTDFDPLAAEPGVDVRFTESPAEAGGADLVILPGSKATVDDLG